MKRTGMVLAAFGVFAAVASAQDQQMGARTKAMGGSYTAFEDDPVSIWLNPAGIAAQPDQGAISYQTYVGYPLKEKGGSGEVTEFAVEPEPTISDPALLPAYLGFVFQLGSPESPMAIGIAHARPYLLQYSLSKVSSPTQTTFDPTASLQESLGRVRLAFGKDFRFRKLGEAGFLPHVAVGVGLDLGYEHWEFENTAKTILGPSTTLNSDTSIGLGFGLGVLLGLYDNADWLKINVGAAYQSAVGFDFDIEPDILPAFDMPQQLNVGVTFYLLKETPLRLTFDFQWINWKDTAEGALFPGFEEFEDAFNFSVGAEYRIKVSDKVFLYPRVGYRRFDAPWGDKDNLPMTGVYRLVLDTKAEAFNLFTFGGGVAWTTESGKLRSIDAGMDVGGDAVSVALSYTHEF
ncbi:MAG: hypothetical protein HYY17_09225 [Planctomycetes bacterium]|nr:hypothetical protein [Planctomycetota bacterium]